MEMKKIKLIYTILAVSLTLGLTSCRNDDEKSNAPSMTFTTTKKAGEMIELLLYFPVGEQVWIDLNNNGKKDVGEEIIGKAKEIIPMDVNNNGKIEYGETIEVESGTYPYTLQSSTVSIYGKVIALDCYNNNITSLDVSKNPSISYLDVSYNKIKSGEMTKLLNGLPNNQNGIIIAIGSNEFDKSHLAIIESKGWTLSELY